MPRSQNIIRHIASSPRVSLSICKSCLLQLQQQRFTSTATSSALQLQDDSSTIGSSHPSALASIQPAYKLKVSVLLSRPPILTRELTPFEKAYFLYQRRLNERLALPFTRYFYYQPGTPGEVEWKRKIKERRTPARDIGIYNAYSKERWNDELLVGARESEPAEQIEAIFQDAIVAKKEGVETEGRKKKEEKIERPMPRATEADKTGDLRSLNRALTRTLYLIVKGSDERAPWEFPTSPLLGNESLHTAAERILVQSAGSNMNTWVVGNIPIGHRTITYPQRIIDSGPHLGEKLFFMKARIMAGQANLKDNVFDLKDFQWLAKEEIKAALSSRDWNDVKNILAER